MFTLSSKRAGTGSKAHWSSSA